jgi:hypothetical protein
LWFDNLSAAVISVLEGDKRKCTEAFERFSLHYRFEPLFCNPGRGNEKGHVENKVGYTRRNWCVPIPSGITLEEIQSQLTKAAEKDRERLHYSKNERIEFLLEQEKVKFLQLPTIPFEVMKISFAKTNKYGEIKIDGEWISVPQACPHQGCTLKISWDQVNILNEQHESVGVHPRPYMNKRVPIRWEEHLQIFRSKPRALPYAAVFKWLPKAVKDWLIDGDYEQRRSRISWLLRNLEMYSMEEIDEVLRTCLTDILNDRTRIEHQLYQNRNPLTVYEKVEEAYTPKEIVGWEPDINRYNSLHPKGGGLS